jgi:hypothetical protein
MHNDTYNTPQIRDLGSLTQVTEDGVVLKRGSSSDAFTALDQNQTGDLPKLP